jgi:hypothetical protein
MQLDNLRKLFLRLREGHLKLNPEKCQLIPKKLRELGHIAPSAGVTTDPEKLEAI